MKLCIEKCRFLKLAHTPLWCTRRTRPISIKKRINLLSKNKIILIDDREKRRYKATKDSQGLCRQWKNSLCNSYDLEHILFDLEHFLFTNIFCCICNMFLLLQEWQQSFFKDLWALLVVKITSLIDLRLLNFICVS